MMSVRNIEVAALSARSEYRRFLCTQSGALAYQKFQRVLYGKDDSLVTEILARVVREMIAGNSGKLAILDVGCGDGKRTSMICNALRQGGVIPEVSLVEQSPIFVEELRGRVAKDELEANIFAGRFEHYRSNRQYDLILAIHSIFGIDGADVIARLLALRKSGGRLLVASNATDSLLGRLKKTLDIGFSEGRLEVDGIREQLASLGAEYRVERFATKWSVSSDQGAEVERLVAGWLGLGRFEEVDRQSQERFHEIFWDSARVVDGRIEWEEEEELVCV